MSDETVEPSVLRAIYSAQAAVAAPMVAITGLMVEKGLITRQELKEALSDLKRPNLSPEAESLYQQIVGILTGS